MTLKTFLKSILIPTIGILMLMILCDLLSHLSQFSSLTAFLEYLYLEPMIRHTNSGLLQLITLTVLPILMSGVMYLLIDLDEMEAEVRFLRQDHAAMVDLAAQAIGVLEAIAPQVQAHLTQEEMDEIQQLGVMFPPVQPVLAQMQIVVVGENEGAPAE